MVCSSCAGSSHGSAAGGPGTTRFGPGGTSSGSASLPSPNQPRPVADHRAGERQARVCRPPASGPTGRPTTGTLRRLGSRLRTPTCCLRGRPGPRRSSTGSCMASRWSPTAASSPRPRTTLLRDGRRQRAQLLWSRHLANAVPSRDLPCGDISPQVGITGTPVIDSTRHEIFVDADTLITGPSSSGGVEASHRLFGLDLFTGQVELDEPALPNAGEDQLAQLQRPGLALDNGSVVIAYGQNVGTVLAPTVPPTATSSPSRRREDRSTISRSAAAGSGRGVDGRQLPGRRPAGKRLTWRAQTATTSAPASRTTTATRCRAVADHAP